MILASRLIRVVATFVILVFFAAGSRTSYWSDCMKASNNHLLADFLHFSINNFLSKNAFKMYFKLFFFRSGVEIPVLEL